MEKITLFWWYNPIRTILGGINTGSFILRKYVATNVYHPVFKIDKSQKSKDKRQKFNKLTPFPFSLPPSYGFTLIELITAIGIIAVLATTTIAVLNPLEQFSKAQDSKRKSDLAQIQRSLESYYQDHQKYPTSCSGLISKNESCVNDVDIAHWGTTWAPYMDVLPIDPTATKNYGYWSDASSGNQSYALYASLDRGGKDTQACNGGAACANASFNTIWCGVGNIICTYGVSSPNITP